MSILDDMKKRFKFTGLLPENYDHGASGSWTTEKKKNPIPPSEAFLAPPSDIMAQGEAAVAKNRAGDAAAMQDAQQQLAVAKAGETSKIDPVTDRYQNAYDESTAALEKFNKDAFGENGNSGRGGSDTLHAYNSPQRGALMIKQRQAYRLLKGGSFADNANLKNEERVKNLAYAENALEGGAYKTNLGNAAISNANTNAANLTLKQRESRVAEDYLSGAKKKKKTEIDLNDIHALFN